MKMRWQPMETYKKDGTIVILLCRVQHEEEEQGWGDTNPIEDDTTYRTIGFNDYEMHLEEDKWSMAGWCWHHDHFTEGNGIPVAWTPMPDKPEST